MILFDRAAVGLVVALLLRASVVNLPSQTLTTETQRTPRLHRELNLDLKFANIEFQESLLCSSEMLNDLLGGIWQRLPKRLRRWSVRLSHPQFSVTAGAVITDGRGRVLLLKHRFRPGTGWGMPGGFMAEGEQPEETLRRELREEVQLDVEKVELFTTRAFKVPKQVEIVFTARAIGDTNQLNFEIQKAAWFFPNELPKELPKDQVQLIKQALGDGARPQD